MDAYWLTATKGRIGEIYNISGTKILSVERYLETLLKLTNIKIKKKVDKNLIRPVDIPLQVPSSTKFRKHTGWKEKNQI